MGREKGRRKRRKQQTEKDTAEEGMGRQSEAGRDKRTEKRKMDKVRKIGQREE